MTYFQQLFYDIKKTNDYLTVGEDVQYKVTVDDKNCEVILQFEESRKIDKFFHSDWFHNLAAFPWILWLDKTPVLTTFGFACAYKSTQNIPIDEFIEACKAHPNYAWKIRGWSFGSAMTQIATRHHYIRRKMSTDDELTYGTVKVWFNPFIKFFAKKWRKTAHNFVCINDLVTWCVPFCHSNGKDRVGGKFSLKKLFNTEHNHNYYEEYDYARFETV